VFASSVWPACSVTVWKVALVLERETTAELVERIGDRDQLVDRRAVIGGRHGAGRVEGASVGEPVPDGEAALRHGRCRQDAVRAGGPDADAVAAEDR
jgi:hypothetical protein